MKTHKLPRAKRITEHGSLWGMDGLEFLRRIPARQADIVFLDPPFNLGKDYGSAQAVEDANAVQYERYLRAVLKESVRVLRPGGALFLYHLPFWAARVSNFLQGQLEFRHWIAVTMKNGFVRGRKLYPAHYALLYLTKGAPKRFKRPRLRPQKCRHCGKLIKNYGGYTDIIKAKGINLSDVWDDTSPVRHAVKKHREANQLPELITERVVTIAGGRGRILIDPFAGTGTSLISAVQRGMRFLGNDANMDFLEVISKRLSESSEPASPRKVVRSRGKESPR